MTNNDYPIISGSFEERLTDTIHDLIIEAVEEEVVNDADFPVHGEDEEGEAYIARRLAEVTRYIKERL